ncbi:MAG: 16S rRNA (uracil(1498)-N(3))-methyltransferase, partial [Candidatus Mariimomonas ferrooxydans]
FLPPEELTTKQITITGEQARYLSLVLHVKPGEQLIILDGLGNQFTCRIIQSRKKEVIAEQLKKAPYSAESPIAITLAQGIAKGDKMDLIIQKSTELGIKKIIPLITKRTQIRHTDKTDRWRKIALSASQQSGREKVPNISEPISYDDFIYSCSEATPTSVGILLYEEEKNLKLKEVLGKLRHCKRIVLLVGPEAGFQKKKKARQFKRVLSQYHLAQESSVLKPHRLLHLALFNMDSGIWGRKNSKCKIINYQ